MKENILIVYYSYSGKPAGLQKRYRDRQAEGSARFIRDSLIRQILKAF